jgi:hypothetical protein
MAHEGMVHALEGIRRLLRSDGVLIDIHPVVEAPLVRVELDGRVIFTESDPGYDYEEDLRQAEAALDRIVERGVYVAGPSHEFDSITYGSSVAELRDHFAEAGAYDERPEDVTVTMQKAQVYARADEAMRSHGERAVILMHERGRMTRLTPLSS